MACLYYLISPPPAISSIILITLICIYASRFHYMTPNIYMHRRLLYEYFIERSAIKSKQCQSIYFMENIFSNQMFIIIVTTQSPFNTV